jgi:hypothetical protein
MQRIAEDEMGQRGCEGGAEEGSGALLTNDTNDQERDDGFVVVDVISEHVVGV